MNSKKENFCFLCQESRVIVGHCTSECPKAVCKICNKLGHTKKKCPESSKKQPQSTHLPLIRSVSNVSSESDVKILDIVKIEPEIMIIENESFHPDLEIVEKSQEFPEEILGTRVPICDLRCKERLNPCSFCKIYKAEGLNGSLPVAAIDQLVSATFKIQKLPPDVEKVFLIKRGSNMHFDILETETPVIRPGCKIVAMFKAKKDLIKTTPEALSETFVCSLSKLNKFSNKSEEKDCNQNNLRIVSREALRLKLNSTYHVQMILNEAETNIFLGTHVQIVPYSKWFRMISKIHAVRSHFKLEVSFTYLGKHDAVLEDGYVFGYALKTMQEIKWPYVMIGSETIEAYQELVIQFSDGSKSRFSPEMLPFRSSKHWNTRSPHDHPEDILQSILNVLQHPKELVFMFRNLQQASLCMQVLFQSKDCYKKFETKLFFDILTVKQRIGLKDFVRKHGLDEYKKNKVSDYVRNDLILFEEDVHICSLEFNVICDSNNLSKSSWIFITEIAMFLRDESKEFNWKYRKHKIDGTAKSFKNQENEAFDRMFDFFMEIFRHERKPILLLFKSTSLIHKVMGKLVKYFFWKNGLDFDIRLAKTTCKPQTGQFLKNYVKAMSETELEMPMKVLAPDTRYSDKASDFEDMSKPDQCVYKIRSWLGKCAKIEVGQVFDIKKSSATKYDQRSSKSRDSRSRDSKSRDSKSREAGEVFDVKKSTATKYDQRSSLSSSGSEKSRKSNDASKHNSDKDHVSSSKERPKSRSESTKDSKSRDSKPSDSKSKDSKSKDSKSRDSKSRDSKSRDSKSRDSKSKDSNRRRLSNDTTSRDLTLNTSGERHKEYSSSVNQKKHGRSEKERTPNLSPSPERSGERHKEYSSSVNQKKHGRSEKERTPTLSPSPERIPESSSRRYSNTSKSLRMRNYNDCQSSESNIFIASPELSTNMPESINVTKRRIDSEADEAINLSPSPSKKPKIIDISG